MSCLNRGRASEWVLELELPRFGITEKCHRMNSHGSNGPGALGCACMDGMGRKSLALYGIGDRCRGIGKGAI